MKRRQRPLQRRARPRCEKIFFDRVRSCCTILLRKEVTLWPRRDVRRLRRSQPRRRLGGRRPKRPPRRKRRGNARPDNAPVSPNVDRLSPWRPVTVRARVLSGHGKKEKDGRCRTPRRHLPSGFMRPSTADGALTPRVRRCVPVRQRSAKSPARRRIVRSVSADAAVPRQLDARCRPPLAAIRVRLAKGNNSQVASSHVHGALVR